jgi:hypothetical protein
VGFKQYTKAQLILEEMRILAKHILKSNSQSFGGRIAWQNKKVVKFKLQ